MFWGEKKKAAHSDGSSITAHGNSTAAI